MFFVIYKQKIIKRKTIQMKNYIQKTGIFTVCLGVLLINSILTAQNLENFHQEIPDDPYIAAPRSSMQKQPAYRVFNSSYFTTQVNVDNNGFDIIGDAGNETSIAVDPTNPNRMVIGWRQFDTVASNFRQAGYGFSIDGGLTWIFPGVLNPGVFRSDPVLDFDADGNFYYNSLQGTFVCDVYKIDDGGVDWNPFVPANGGDKQWMRVDRTNGIGSGNVYSNWNLSFTTCAWDFTRSTDGAASFESCIEVDSAPRWGTIAVDADGTLYICGQSGGNLVVIKSTTAKDPNIPVSFDSVNTVDLEGLLATGGVNPQGLLGQMWIDVDISGGVGHGNVYVLASVDRNSNSDLGDVMFAKSTDGGESFEAPIKINTDSGTDNIQWFGTMAVAPNGRIDVVWLDTRDAPVGTNDSVLYYSFSEDQGETWTENLAISLPFDPHIGYPQQNKMGDYYDMVSDNNGAHLAWSNTINGGQDVYYTYIDPNGVLGLNDLSSELNNSIVYPNPFKNETTIKFSLKNEEYVTVNIYDLLGRKQATLLQGMFSENQSLTWKGTNTNNQQLAKGLYFVEIKTESSKKVIKVIKY
ncbi:MAG: hypothetical protein COB12_12845 [Flavobacterium sp.]|nr:MAG: hypothetical protein COB12_12845 [Flavobacterium sp.]